MLEIIISWSGCTRVGSSRLCSPGVQLCSSQFLPLLACHCFSDQHLSEIHQRKQELHQHRCLFSVVLMLRYVVHIGLNHLFCLSYSFQCSAPKYSSFLGDITVLDVGMCCRHYKSKSLSCFRHLFGSLSLEGG